VIADDHSTDNTRKIAENMFLHVILNTGHKGVGRNTATGIALAWSLGADIVVTLDGDGQHNPSDIPKLLEPITKYGADIVIGARDWTPMPWYRQVGNLVIDCAYDNRGLWLTGKHVVDTQSGFRVYTRKAIETIRWEDNGFGFSTETLIKARKLKLKVIEVPINVIYHADLKENSSSNPVKHGVGVLLKTLRWRWWEINA
jgi:glycosyltransferase involved in cell wall biosynthesis